VKSEFAIVQVYFEAAAVPGVFKKLLVASEAGGAITPEVTAAKLPVPE
jgi:hypothetical protein